jgi:pimeloyl-ACP methyl ester carboxylesterase
VSPIKRLYLEGAGPRLCCLDFGGDGPPILLVHGLGGRGAEWWSTASWLASTHRVFALDQRGHGRSDKALGDFSRDAYVTDVIRVLEWLAVGPAILLGQSMGGLNAFLAAARRPELVRALIVAEASPAQSPRVQQGVQHWLSLWPLPFPTLADARAFFGGETLYAQTWLEVLEEHADGYWPQFDQTTMVGSMADVAERDYWQEWEQVRCPTLIIGGANSFVSQDELQEMATRIPLGDYRQIADAGHDVHLEQPQAWRAVVTGFLQELTGTIQTS